LANFSNKLAKVVKITLGKTHISKKNLKKIGKKMTKFVFQKKKSWLQSYNFSLLVNKRVISTLKPFGERHSGIVKHQLGGM
jgi:hypothetical protein